jgi:hypothetical protein
MEAIQKLDVTIVPHPPYSPDLAPHYVHLFPKMKEDHRGYLCDSNEEVERNFRTWMKKRIVEFFHDGFQNLSIVGRSVWRMEVIMWRSRCR